MKNEFLTKDLYLSAYLYARGCRFLRVNREGRTCWFSFEGKENCEKLQMEFFSRTGEVIGQDYASAIRTLKDLVFSKG